MGEVVTFPVKDKPVDRAAPMPVSPAGVEFDDDDQSPAGLMRRYGYSGQAMVELLELRRKLGLKNA